jgi:hypothetical protein
MNYNPNNRIRAGERKTEPKIAKGFDLFSSPMSESDMERIDALGDRLMTLFMGLERGDRFFTDSEGQSRRIQEEISILVRMLEDWRIWIVSRN